MNRHCRSDSASPVFIVGAPRSGTTLLCEILNRHPDLFVFNETLVFDFVNAHDLWHLNDQADVRLLLDHMCDRVTTRTVSPEGKDTFGGHFIPESRDVVCGKLMEKQYDSQFIGKSFHTLYSSCMAATARVKGKMCWGDKTPNHIFYLDRIAQLFENAKIIHIVRDPRMFLRSYKHAWRRGDGKVRRMYHPVVTSLVWQRALGGVIKNQHLFPGRFMEVRYEDLRDFPCSEVKSICRFLGVDFCLEMIDIKGSNTSFLSRADHMLAPHEIAVCEHINGRLMARYRYGRRSDKKRFIGSVIRNALTIPWFFVKLYPDMQKRFKGNLPRLIGRRLGWGR